MHPAVRSAPCDGVRFTLPLALDSWGVWESMAILLDTNDCGAPVVLGKGCGREGKDTEPSLETVVIYISRSQGENMAIQN